MTQVGGFSPHVGLANILNSLTQTHRIVEQGIGLTAIVNFKILNVRPQNLNAANCIFYVFNHNGAGGFVPIAMDADINIFTTPASLEINPYVGNEYNNPFPNHNLVRNTGGMELLRRVYGWCCTPQQLQAAFVGQDYRSRNGLVHHAFDDPAMMNFKFQQIKLNDSEDKFGVHVNYDQQNPGQANPGPPVVFTYTRGAALAANPGNNPQKNSNLLDYVYCVDRNNYGTLSRGADVAQNDSQEVFDQNRFKSFTEVISPGQVNYCMVHTNLGQQWFHRDYNNGTDVTTRQDFRTLMCMTVEWDSMINPYFYMNFPLGAWRNASRIRGKLQRPGVNNPDLSRPGPPMSMEINMGRRTHGPLHAIAGMGTPLEQRKREDRLERELRYMSAKFDSYFYTRARLMMESGHVQQMVQQQQLQYGDGVGIYHGQQYARVIYDHGAVGGGKRAYRFLYRGCKRPYNTYIAGFAGPGGVPIMAQAGAHGAPVPVHQFVGAGFPVPPGSPAAPLTKPFIHLSYTHTSHQIDTARRFGTPAAGPGYLYIIHLTQNTSTGIPYLSYDNKPIASHFRRVEGEILLPRNCVLQVDPLLAPQNLAEAKIVYKDPGLTLADIRQVPGANTLFHQIRLGGNPWIWAIHCRLCPPHNCIKNLKHEVMQKSISERLVFPFNSNPQFGYNGPVAPPAPAGMPQPPVGHIGNLELCNKKELRKQIINWFNRNKTSLINPHTGNVFHANASILHSDNNAIQGMPMNDLWAFGTSPAANFPDKMFGGKKKRKKKTKKKNRKTKHKTSRKKR